MASVKLVTPSGVVVFEGTIEPPPGGSQPGALLSKTFLFTEGPTAGTYSAEFAVAAGTEVLEVLLLPQAAPWAADTAQLSIGDTLNGAGSYFNALDLTAQLATPYDPTSPTQGTGGNFTGMDGGNDYAAAGFMTDTVYPAAPGVIYDNADTITLSLVTTIAVPPVVAAGVLVVKIIYIAPITPVAATFA